jgi:3-phosphoshikimate 1-carboxyvinyltransferase
MIDCGNSATTLRLLAGAMAAWGVEATLDGSPGLRRRPMRRIVEPLRQMGVSIEDTEGCAPLVLRPSVTPLKGLDYTLSVASAQVKSCLLLAALAGNSPTMLREPGPSRDHTERMLRAMGVEVHSEPTANSRQPSAGGALAPNSYFLTHLSPPRPLNLAPLHTVLPGDISAAAFLIVAALITPGSQVSLRGVGLNPTRTGLLDALAVMGADIAITDQSERSGEPVGNLTIRHCQLEGVQIGGDLVVRMIDEFPAFAIAAAYATGVTTVSDAVELRHKESDRISDLAQELRRLGVEIAETPDGFVVHGGRPLSGGLIWPHGDHRLAMSLAVAGLAAQEPVTIQEAGIIHESFPGFAETLQTLGADIRLEE